MRLQIPGLRLEARFGDDVKLQSPLLR